MIRVASFALSALSAVAVMTASAQEPMPPKGTPEAGAKGGDVPSAFRAFVVWDKRFDAKDVRNRTDKPHCLVCANGLNPVVAVFAPAIPTDQTDPVAGLLKDLDQATADRKADSMAASVNFLVLPDELQFDAQRDKLVADAKAMAEQAKLKATPVGLAAKKSKATAAWKLDGNNAEAVTVVLYNHLRVIERWTFADGKPTDADRKAILAAIEKEVPVKK